MIDIKDILNKDRNFLINLSKEKIEEYIQAIDNTLKKNNKDKYELILKKSELLLIINKNLEALTLLNDFLQNNSFKNHENYLLDFNLEIGRIYITLSKYEKAIQHLNEAETLSVRQNKTNFTIRIKMLKANILSNQGLYEQADKLYREILKLTEKTKSKVEIANCYSDMGLMEIRKGNYEKAISCYNNSIKIYEELGTEDYLYIVNANIGLIYLKLDNYEQAIEYTKKAAKFAKKLKEWHKLSQIYNNLGSIYIKNNDFEKAEKYLKETIKLKIQIGDKLGLSKALNNISNILITQKKYQEAEKYISMSIKIKIKNKDYISLIHSYTNLAGFYVTLEQYEKALITLKEASSLLEKYGTIENYINIHYNYYKIYESLGNFEKALEYFEKYEEKYFEHKEKIHSDEMQTLLKKYEEEKTEKEKRLYYLKNIELKRANETKNRLFSIIAHDLKSPFSSIISFISLMKHGYDRFSNDKILRWITELENTVNNTFMLLENLLTWSKMHSNAIKFNPKSFAIYMPCKKTFELLLPRASAKNITLINKVEENIFVFADYFMIETVIRNIVNNAIKFTPENGKIIISSELGKNTVVLKIIDNGVGISEENQKKLFKLETSFTTYGTNKEKGTGLGLIVCKDFVEKNNGTISVHSKVGKGTTFIINLPLSIM